MCLFIYDKIGDEKKKICTVLPCFSILLWV